MFFFLFCKEMAIPNLLSWQEIYPYMTPEDWSFFNKQRINLKDFTNRPKGTSTQILDQLARTLEDWSFFNKQRINPNDFTERAEGTPTQILDQLARFSRFHQDLRKHGCNTGRVYYCSCVLAAEFLVRCAPHPTLAIAHHFCDHVLKLFFH